MIKFKIEQGEELPLIDLNEENQSLAKISINEILTNSLKQLIYFMIFLNYGLFIFK